MAKFFLIYVSSVSSMSLALIGTRASYVPQGIQDHTRYRISVDPKIEEPFKEKYVVYRRKRIVQTDDMDVLIAWVIKVPDSYVVEFKLKYNDVIYKQYG